MSHIPIISAEEVIRVGNSCTIYSVELLREFGTLANRNAATDESDESQKGREAENFRNASQFFRTYGSSSITLATVSRFFVKLGGGAALCLSRTGYIRRVCTRNPGKVSRRFGYADSSLQRRQKCDVVHSRNDRKFIVDCTYFLLGR